MINGKAGRIMPNGRRLWTCADEAGRHSYNALTVDPTDEFDFAPDIVENIISLDRISFPRMYTDRYELYRHVSRGLYDYVARGGILIFNDYGHSDRLRKTDDEFWAKRKMTQPLLGIEPSCQAVLKLTEAYG